MHLGGLNCGKSFINPKMVSLLSAFSFGAISTHSVAISTYKLSFPGSVLVRTQYSPSCNYEE